MINKSLMDFDTFVLKIKSILPGFIESKCPEYEVEFDITPKVNGAKECIRGGIKNENIMKNIYLEDIYEDYVKHGNLEECVNYIVETITSEPIPTIRDDFISLINDLERVKNMVTYFVVNQGMNAHLLERVPHRKLLDLAVIYKFTVDKKGEAIGKVIITNDMAEKWGMSEEDLYRFAAENTERLFSTMIKKVSDDFIIVSNEVMINGAAAIVNKEIIRSIAEDIGEDIYIVPSSIHDLIVLRKSMHNPESILSTIKHVNDNVVNREDILSYNLYSYSLREDTIKEV